MYTFISKCWPRKYRVCRSPIKIALFALLLSWGLIWIIILYGKCELNSMVNLNRFLIKNSGTGYLVNSSKCQIIDLDPFDEEIIKFYRSESYESCSKQPLLTYVKNVDNVVTLNVNQDAVSSYSTSSVVCCYSNITRKDSPSEVDNAITTTECFMFKDSITLHHDTVYVRCFSKDRDIIYENTHTTLITNEEVQKKIKKKHPKKQISVLLVGIDSLSRLNFIRALPKTHEFVDNNGWIPLKAYNKIDDNTLPNLIAILTGHNHSDITTICDPTEQGTFDKCPMLWSNYSNLGYVTGYAEDECLMSTFNFHKVGFTVPPTDFYFRPYMLASEKLTTKKKQGMTYCTGPETSGERILNLAKDFAVTFKKHPHFGMFWMNSFSHNQLNSVSGMDDKIKEFLLSLNSKSVLENSVVIFFSDHGIRFGGIRLTDAGWLEERLPFIYVSFPTWFKKTFQKEFNNFKTNSDRLTSPYDLHMTLQHFLALSGHDYAIIQSPGCLTCKSLLDEIDEDRSCEEAGIEQHWCTCSGYAPIKLEKDVEKNVSAYILNRIHKIIESYEDGWMCSRYFVHEIISSSISQKLSHTDDTYLLLRFRTIPEAVFESTVNFNGNLEGNNFSISGSISRLDRYFPYSNCVTNANLKKYCYCLR